MSNPTCPSRRASVLGLLMLATTFAVTAEPPQIQLGAETLDRYEGTYRYSDTGVVHVERVGDHLAVRWTGETTAKPSYAESDTIFVYAGSDAKIEFVLTGLSATEAVLRQNTAETRMPRVTSDVAAAIEASVEQRVANQTANPASEPALRRLMDNILHGELELDRLCPQLTSALTNDLPQFQARLAELGAPSAFRWVRVSSSGNDEYEVTHEHGVSQWGLTVDADGVITAATLQL